MCLGWKQIEIYSSKYHATLLTSRKQESTMVKIINFNVTFDRSINFFECHKYAYTICNTQYFLLNQDKVLFIWYSVRAHQ